MKLSQFVEMLMEQQINHPELSDKEVAINVKDVDHAVYDVDHYDPIADEEDVFGVCITVGDPV